MKDEIKIVCDCATPNKKCGYLSLVPYKDKTDGICALCSMPKKYNVITLNEQGLKSLKEYLNELLCEIK